MANNEHEITLGILNSIHGNSHITQRSMAGELGIALGLTNSYLKRCIKKGLIKVQQAPSNRYAYYLTPQGLSEKSRLASEFLVQGFRFFRIAREQCSEIFSKCSRQGLRRVVLHGLTDLAEIAVLCAKDCDIELVCIIDPGSQLRSYSGIPIFRDIPDTASFDVIVVTDLGNPQREYNALSEVFEAENILVRAILKVTPILEITAGGMRHD